MAALNCDIGKRDTSYCICRRGNKVILVLLYNLCILLVLPNIILQTTCQFTNTIDIFKSNENNVNKKVIKDDYVYVSDYLKRIREVGNFDRYLPPSQQNDFIDVSSYPAYPYVDYYPFTGEGAVPYDPEPLQSTEHYYPTQSYFRELGTESPSSIAENVNEDVEHTEQPITFKYSELRQLNYTIASPDNVHLIDVDYENDMYFLHNHIIIRINLGETGAKFETVATVDDTIEPVKEAHLITWHELLIVLVREGDHYNVYVKTPHGDNIRNIQRLVFPNSKLRKCKLLMKDDHVYLVVTIGLNKAVGKIILYKWHDSHFIKEYEQETFVVDELFFFKSEQDPLVMIVSHGNRFNTKTKANLYHIAADGKFDLLQYIFFGIEVVHKFTLKNSHYILACYSKNVCFIHKFENGKFTKAHQINRKYIRTIGVESDNAVIGIQLDDQLVFSPNPDISRSVANTDISTLYLYKFSIIELQQSNRKYLVLFYLHPSHLNIQMIEIEINQENIVGETLSGTGEQEFIKAKMNELRLLLESRGEIIREINDIASIVIRKDKSANIQSPVKTAAPIYVENGIIKSLTIHCDPLKVNAEHLLHDIVSINARTNDLLHHMRPYDQYYERYKRDFKPNHKTKKIIAKNLHYEGAKFKNLLVKSRPNVLQDDVYVKSIETDHLNVTKNIINNIYLDDVVKQGYTEEITGLKAFNKISTKMLNTQIINDIKVAPDVPKERTSFRAVEGEDGFLLLRHDISVDKLQISRVNSLSWTDIEKSTELKSTNKINGNLYIKRPSLVRNLNVDAIHHIAVPDLMTKESDQEINSVVWINNFLTPSISTRTVNGVNFKENVALHGQENHIRSHVAIAKMNVTNGLKLTEEDVASGRHVVGTRKEDLLQFYTRDVVIQGSLTLKRVQTDSEFTQVLVSDRQFSMDVDEYYWVDHKSQNIPSFKFHSTVTVPQLYTNVVNSHAASDFLLVHPDSKPNKHMRVVLKQAHIPGHVIAEADTNSKLVQISRDCVRRGDSIDVTGTLTFDGELSVDLINSLSINGQAIEKFATKDVTSYHFTSTKRLHNLNVYGDLYSSDKFNVQNYNGTDFGTFMSQAVYTNEPFYLGNVLFDEIRIHNLTVHEMQGIRFDQFLSNVYSVLNTSTSVRNIRVSENAFFEHELHADVVNDVSIPKLYNTIVRKDRGATISGTKTFKSGVKVKKNVWMPKINGYDLRVWQDSALTSSAEQIILGNWKMNHLKTKYLSVKYINGISVADILNAKDSALDIYTDIVVESLKGVSDCQASLKHDISGLIHAIHNPPAKSYNSITCENTLLYPMHFKSKFTDILTDAITVHGDHPINAKVEFINRPFINDAKSSAALINGINILNVYTDALKYHSPDKKQLIHAPKKFIDPIEIKFSVVKYKLDSIYVNGVNVVELNNTIYRKNQGNYILEKKVFLKTPIIGELNVDGHVNGVNLANVAFEKDGRSIDNLYVDQLQVVNDLIMQNVNNMSLDYLLDNRVRLYGAPQEIYGNLSFQKLGVYGLNHIPYINGIDSRSLVYLKWPETQIVSGKKTIKGVLNLNGPIHCLKLNDKDLIDTIRSNVKLDMSEYLKTLYVNNLVAHAGIVVTEEVDKHPISSVLNVTPKSLDKMLPTVPHLKEIVHSTHELVQKQVSTKRFLYLDYATDLEIVYKTEEIDAIQSHTQLLVDSNSECPEQLVIKVTNAGKIFIRKYTAEYQTYCKDSQLHLQVTVGSCSFDKNLLISWMSDNKRLNATYPFKGALKSTLDCFTMNDKQFIGFLSSNTEHTNTYEVIYLTKANQWGLKQVLDIQDANNAKILLTNSYTLLVVTSSKDVDFYNLNKHEERFDMMETITGSYNLISDLVTVGGERMIGLALKNSKAVTIFKLLEDSYDGPEIQFFQTLRFEARVKAIKTFTMNGESHLAIIMTNGHFYIYRYNYIDGWIQINYSYFEGMESLVSFLHQNNEYLLVVSPNSASAIRIYNQN